MLLIIKSLSKYDIVPSPAWLFSSVEHKKMNAVNIYTDHEQQIFKKDEKHHKYSLTMA